MGWGLKLSPGGDVRSYHVTSASIKTVPNVLCAEEAFNTCRIHGKGINCLKTEDEQIGESLGQEADFPAAADQCTRECISGNDQKDGLLRKSWLLSVAIW